MWGKDEIRIGKGTSVVCFGSPSAVMGWSRNVGAKPKAACIGETSYKQCRDEGWAEEDIFYPEKPGVPGWADAAKEAVEKVMIDF